MLSLTTETNEDITPIREVITGAFARRNEADLVEVIRASPNFIRELSLVAVENGNVLGHILFSHIVIEAPKNNTIPAIALAPLSVLPHRQREGIGRQLVQAGLSKCRDLNYRIVVVLGDPHYYGRFGFQTASPFGVQAPFPVPDEAFMVLELKPGALSECSGTVRYPAYFDEV